MTCDVLVIGYGNTLRGDDGIGPAVARAVAERAFPGVRVIITQQLTPELAADLAACRRAVFIDAATTGEAVATTQVAAGPSPPSLTHGLDPRALLTLAGSANGSSPEAWLVTVPGTNFGYGEGLSVAARLRLGAAVDRVKCLLGV
jgi:hydrogenase maturation protease